MHSLLLSSVASWNIHIAHLPRLGLESVYIRQYYELGFYISPSDKAQDIDLFIFA
jgi:hypothetical protein